MITCIISTQNTFVSNVAIGMTREALRRSRSFIVMYINQLSQFLIFCHIMHLYRNGVKVIDILSSRCILIHKSSVKFQMVSDLKSLQFRYQHTLLHSIVIHLSLVLFQAKLFVNLSTCISIYRIPTLFQYCRLQLLIVLSYC